MLFANIDDIDIIEHTKRDVAAAYSAMERMSADMVIVVNQGMWRIRFRITTGNYTFDLPNEYVDLASFITKIKMSFWRSIVELLILTGVTMVLVGI